jgi:deoxycytidylate deaminase
MPCYECAKAIISAGIVRVVWAIPYRLTGGIELLNLANVQCEGYTTFEEIG